MMVNLVIRFIATPLPRRCEPLGPFDRRFAFIPCKKQLSCQNQGFAKSFIFSPFWNVKSFVWVKETQLGVLAQHTNKVRGAGIAAASQWRAEVEQNAAQKVGRWTDIYSGICLVVRYRGSDGSDWRLLGSLSCPSLFSCAPRSRSSDRSFSI